MSARKFWTAGSGSLKQRIMVAPIWFLAPLLFASPADAGSIQSIQTDHDSVTIHFDEAVSGASAFALAGPNRIAIDVMGTKIGQAVQAKGAFRQVRQGQFGSNTARLVLDLDYPIKVVGGAFSSDGKTLTLGIAPSTASEFIKSITAAPFEWWPFGKAKPQKSNYEVSAPISRGQGLAGLPKIYGPADGRLPLVVIDAGHGGHDPGASNKTSGHREKDVTLAIAKAVRDELLKTGRVRVALTRDTDSFIVLQERYGIARKLKADLFMSIHCDAAENASAQGATVYTLSEVASDREAQRLAARENKSDIINGVNLGGADANVSNILIDLTQRETMNVSANFAKLLLREAGPNMTLRAASHKFASFVVLKAPDMPSILFETGYISNANDAAFLGSAAGQQAIARSVSGAVQAHFARRLTQ